MKKDQEENLVTELIIKALEKLDKTTSRIDERMDEMNVTLVRNTDSLEVHIRRTDLLESKFSQDIEPAIKFYNGVLFVGKLIGLLAVIATILGVAFEGIKFFLKV